MLASDVLKKKNCPVVRINSKRTVLQAIELLDEKRFGSLMVEDDAGKIVGIITERDILNLSPENSQRFGEIRVEEVMTRDLITGVAEDKVNDLLRLMTNHRVRHLPIMRDEKLVGLVSIGDLVKVQLDEIETENGYLKQYIQSG